MCTDEYTWLLSAPLVPTYGLGLMCCQLLSTAPPSTSTPTPTVQWNIFPCFPSMLLGFVSFCCRYCGGVYDGSVLWSVCALYESVCVCMSIVQWCVCAVECMTNVFCGVCVCVCVCVHCVRRFVCVCVCCGCALNRLCATWQQQPKASNGHALFPHTSYKTVNVPSSGRKV